MENSNQGQDGGHILRLDGPVTGWTAVSWETKPCERRPLEERVFAPLCCRPGASHSGRVSIRASPAFWGSGALLWEHHTWLWRGEGLGVENRLCLLEPAAARHLQVGRRWKR